HDCGDFRYSLYHRPLRPLWFLGAQEVCLGLLGGNGALCNGRSAGIHGRRLPGCGVPCVRAVLPVPGTSGVEAVEGNGRHELSFCRPLAASRLAMIYLRSSGVKVSPFFTANLMGRGAPFLGTVTSAHSSSPRSLQVGSKTCSRMKNATGSTRKAWF